MFFSLKTRFLVVQYKSFDKHVSESTHIVRSNLIILFLNILSMFTPAFDQCIQQINFVC